MTRQSLVAGPRSTTASTGAHVARRLSFQEPSSLAAVPQMNQELPALPSFLQMLRLRLLEP
jgi:hypothetical protein